MYKGTFWLSSRTPLGAVNCHCQGQFIYVNETLHKNKLINT